MACAVSVNAATPTYWLRLDRSNVIGCYHLWLTGPLAGSHEIKGFFYKGYFRQNKGCFIEILTKIKSKSTSNVLVFLCDPNL